MKKRVLSMLLLVVMVVTALPLTVLTALAAEEEKTYTEADYNALYVDTGLTFAADFYKTNKYWNDGETGTVVTGTIAVAKSEVGGTFLNKYTYFDDNNFRVITANDSTVTVQDGYLSLANVNQLRAFINSTDISQKINSGAKGGSYEVVRNYTQKGRILHFLGVRITADVKDGIATAYNGPGDAVALSVADFNALNALGTNLVFSDLTGVSTFSMSLLRPACTNAGISGSTAAGTGENLYSNKIYNISSYTPEGGAEAKTMVDVTDIAMDTGKSISAYTYPFKRVTPDYIKDAEGNITANTKGYVFCVAQNPRFVYGDIAIYQNGTKLYSREDGTFPYVNNTTNSNDVYIFYGGQSGSDTTNPGKIYAVRYYAHELTAEEIAQNHFADIAKWFKLDLTPLNAISEDDYDKIAPAFASFTFDSDKAVVQETLVAVVKQVINEKYAGTSAWAYAALAARYGIDLSVLLAYPKGMLPATHAFLSSGYLSSTDVKGDYAKALAADYAAMWSADVELSDYNYLYTAQADALISLDFFGTNEIWGQSMELPTPPYEQTEYVYAGVTYDFTKEEDRLVQTNRRWAVRRSDNYYVYYNKAGALAASNANYPATSGSVNYSQTMPRQTFTYEEAQKVLAAAQKAWDKLTIEIVELPLWTIWRQDAKGAKQFYTINNNWQNNQPKTIAVYLTQAEAEAKIAAIKQDGYTYTTAVRPLATAAYQQCITDYAEKITKDYMGASDISGNNKITFTQQMVPVSAETNYHSPEGITRLTSHVSFKDGYMVFATDGTGGRYFTTPGIPQTGDLYLDAVMAGGDKDATGNGLLALRGAKFGFTVKNAGTTFTGLSNHSMCATKDYTDEVKAAVVASPYTVEGRNTPFRLTVSSTVTDDKKNISFKVNVDGNAVLSTGKLPFDGSGDGLLGHSVSAEARFYTYRLYNRILKAEEQAQNHFADIAKFFALNLTGYDALDDDGKAAVHAAVADITFANTRAEAQNAINEAMYDLIKAAYNAMKAEHPEVPAAFIDLACEYRLDLSEVLASDADLGALYAISFEGLNCAEAQVLLDETYYDVVTFYPHQRAGEDVWNRWILDVAKANKCEDINDLLVLPFALRKEITRLANNTDPDVISAFAAEKLALYSNDISVMSAEAYNALYVQDGLLMAMDFFGTNNYWNGKYELPLAPSDNTAYLYDANGDGTPESYDLTNATERATTITAEGDKNKGKTVFAVAKAEWQTAYKDYMNKNFVWTDGEMQVSVYGSSGETQERAPFYLTDGGYAQFHDKYASSGGFVFSGIPANALTSSAQLVISMSKYDSDGESTAPLLFHNIRPVVLVHNDKVTFTGLSGSSSIGGLYYSMLTLAATKETTVYAEYDSRMMASRTAIANDADAYAAELNATAAEGEAYSAKKIHVNKYEIHKTIGENSVLYATFDLMEKPNPAYLLETNPSIEYAYGEVFDLTAGVQLANGDDYFILRTQDGTVGEITAPYDASAAKLDSGNYYIGWGTVHKHMKMYAFRHYDHIISDADILQNHFIDLAKFFRIDLTDYLKLDEDARAAVHTAMKDFDLGTADRADVIAALYTALYTADYTAAEAVLSADMLAIARELALNVSALMKADSDVRAYAESIVLADFAPGQPMERSVVQSLIDQALVYSAGFTFEGVQVRVQSANEANDMPGVRAIFSVNRAAIEAYADLGKAITFGVEICDANGNMLSVLTFSVNRKVDAEGNVTYKYEGKNGEQEAKIREVGENSLAFAYTVIFDNANVQTAPYYEYEFAYRFFMEVDGLRNNANMLKSQAFEDTISAAEAYRYFYTHGYDNDRVVKSVITELNGGNDVILVKTPEEAQAALDNATSGTTIQLAANVDYGTLVFRQTASSTVVDITEAGGDAPGNEKYRRIEDLTILGAEGATVDGFDFLVSWIDGSGASYIDIKNLTVEGVTFSGEATPFLLTKGSLGIDGLTIVDCKMNDADGNNRLVFQQINGYKVLNDKSTGEYVMTTGIKDLTITGCEVVGAYMVIESRAMENLTITNNTFYGIKERDMLITSDTTYYSQMTYSGTITITGNTSECGEERFVRASLNNSDVTVVIKDNTIINYRGKDADYIKVTDVDMANVTIENNPLVP